MSSVRHVWDRRRTLAELRRVVRPDGIALVVELDPAAEPRRVRAHLEAIPSSVARLTFAPFLLGLAPPAAEIAALATEVGWLARWEPDPVQPFYWMWLT
jgi:ubiquinone/menaquinone biosynthesis C-methylase UbiE